MKRHIPFIVLIASILLWGCSHTPQQAYDAAVLRLQYERPIALAIARKNPEYATELNVLIATISDNVDLAKKWLADNPTLVNVAGVKIPSLDLVNEGFSILAAEFVTILLPPSTQPAPLTAHDLLKSRVH